MKKISLFVLIVFTFSNCKSQCNTIDKFNSYNQAISVVQKTYFPTTDNLPANKSSWIVSANYYSCDGNTGYMIYKTARGATYIHSMIPINIWNDFKKASSSGSYYNYNIKGKYALRLN